MTPALPSGQLGDLDPTSDRAVFRQIADQLREAIDRGRFREGEKLPSEAELVDHYGVSRMTVRNSFSILQGEGLVHAEHGKGVFVRPRPPYDGSPPTGSPAGIGSRASPRSSSRRTRSAAIPRSTALR